MGTKKNPGQFDCYVKAKPDEPMFILLGRDSHAPDAVNKWANDREVMINIGIKPKSDMAMVHEARECAQAMKKFYNSSLGMITILREDGYYRVRFKHTNERIGNWEVARLHFGLWTRCFDNNEYTDEDFAEIDEYRIEFD